MRLVKLAIWVVKSAMRLVKSVTWLVSPARPKWRRFQKDRSDFSRLQNSSGTALESVQPHI
jgi:hypothetical protein